MKVNYNKSEIVKELSNQAGYSKNLSKKLIDDLIDSMISCINAGEIKFKNFGTFRLIEKKQRLGRNPKTKEEFIISARKSVKFTISSKFLNELDNI